MAWQSDIIDLDGYVECDVIVIANMWSDRQDSPCRCLRSRIGSLLGPADAINSEFAAARSGV
ncbi:MAG: hypothetical protein A2Y76_01785 [Planctomycetes bacterium RBG_13_60_9]|nr:MAG: hypothetical protein A2Y76_01785 [Planctomycetes bacterium RBG_13_60_9]